MKTIARSVPLLTIAPLLVAAGCVAQPTPAVGLKAGDKALDFKLKGSDGKDYDLAQFNGAKAIALCWFPRAGSGGATIQCAALQAAMAQIPADKVQVFGCSTAALDVTTSFAQAGQYSFPVLSDFDKTAVQAYGCLRSDGSSERWTFLIDDQGTILAINKSVTPQTQGTELTRMLAAAGLTGAGPTPQAAATGDQQITVDVAGQKRTCLLHLPPAYDATRQLPVVIALHGARGNGQGMAGTTGFNALADKYAFIAAYPDGLAADHTWNGLFGKIPGGEGILADDVDDIAFLRTLIGSLRETYHADPARVFVCGHSAGAYMSYRAAVELPDLIAAAGVVNGSLGIKSLDGKTWETQIRVLNRGNSTVSLRAAMETEQGSGTTVEPSSFTLAAGAQQVVVVKGFFPPREPRSRSLTIAVGFKDAQDETKPPLASASLAVTAIARQAGDADLSRRLPTELALRLSGGSEGSAWQAQWSGAGVLDDQGKRKVSFLLRAPDTRNEGVFGLSSEAHLNYSDPTVDLSLGDQTYGLSYLTEYLGYGRGAGLDWRMGARDESTLYFYRSQGSVARFSQAGLRVQHQLDSRWLVAANLLSRQADATDSASLADNGEIGSLEVACRPARDAQLRLEVGNSRSDRCGTDTAYEVEARGKLGSDATYSLHKLRAGADYAGHVHDLDLSSVSLSAPLLERLRLSASLSEYRSNLEQRPNAGSAPRERLWRVGADYPLAREWSAGLTYSSYRQRDALGIATTDSDDQALSLVLARSDARSSLRAALSRGRHRDLSTGAVSSPWSLDLMGVYREGSRCTVTAFGGLGQERNYDASPLLGLSRQAGVSLDWQARPDLSCSLWYTDQRPAAIFNSDSAQAQLLLSYHPGSGKAWEVQLRRSSFADGPVETSYAVTYSLPISLAIGRRHDVGVLSGRVFDAERPQHPGLAGATVIVDDQAVCSDAEGRFAVGGLRPGKHHLQVDRASIGLQRVTTVPSPVEVEITGGRTARLDLGVVTAARVEGVVELRAAAPAAGAMAVTGAPRSPAKAAPASVAGLLIELTCEGERRQGLSDAEGRFLFEGLRPGLWRLSVQPASLPAHYYAEPSGTELTLQPGQRCAAQVEIIEQARRIRMLAPAGPETLISAP